MIIFICIVIIYSNKYDVFYLQLFIESELEDDFQSFSYIQILVNKQKKEQRYQQLLSQMFFYIDFFQFSIMGSDLFQKLFVVQYLESLIMEQRFVRQGIFLSDSFCQEVDFKFRSDYYSFCMVGFKGSLFSGSNDGDNEQFKVE